MGWWIWKGGNVEMIRPKPGLISPPFFALFSICPDRACLVRHATGLNPESEILSKCEIRNQLICDERQKILIAWYSSGGVQIVIINLFVYSHGKHWVSTVCQTLEKILELQRSIRQDSCPQSTWSGEKERQVDNYRTMLGWQRERLA